MFLLKYYLFFISSLNFHFGLILFRGNQNCNITSNQP